MIRQMENYKWIDKKGRQQKNIIRRTANIDMQAGQITAEQATG
jgi:hypothetical protein